MFGFYNLYFLLSKKTYIISCFALIGLLFYQCQSGRDQPAALSSAGNSPVYLNHSDTARYVGMETCKLCHASIYNTFIKTGMGKSFDLASRSKSAGDFSSTKIYDETKGFYYRAFWEHDSLYFQEYRLNHKDTIHSRTEQVNYIIGSGQHTNSHLSSTNGYVKQMPMTFYTQKGKWDLPPGFEHGNNTRFNRKIGLECMSCHNAYPDFVMGSENKYIKVPQGIDCERCHGPGSIHVAQRSSGSKIDTALYIDYSIVNPSKLSIEAQFDICQRCHLQGNAVLKPNRSFFDFKPGQKLSDFMTVFLPKYKGADDEFIMASHADRLKQSACFIKSVEKVQKKNQLKPYKEALTCVTCHNPHVSVKETNTKLFNQACVSCHASNEKIILAHGSLPSQNITNCVSCHMPVSDALDIPHVTVHDHYIRKPLTSKEKEKIKQFVGLYAVNEKNPEPLTRAKAYINQYDKFEANTIYLDSAERILVSMANKLKTVHAEVQFYFIKQEFGKIIALINKIGEQKCYEKILVKKSYDNQDAWTAYRIGESYYYSNNLSKALIWLKRATELAPYHLDFRNKLGTYLSANGDNQMAKKEFNFILSQNPEFVQAYSNLGYLELVEGHSEAALKLYNSGLKLDPDNEALLLNLAGYYLFMKDKTKANYYLQRVLKLNKNNTKANQILKQMQTVI